MIEQRNLVIVRAGTRSLHNTWLDRNASRTWDLLICPYEEILATPGQGVIVCNTVPGPKWTGLKRLLTQWQGWREYRYILLADDDLFATQNTWTRFFDRCVHYDAKLAQPALTQGSYFSHLVTLRCPEFVARRVSYIEVMMPCFAVDVLAALLDTLDLTKTGSGWAIDSLWAKRLRYDRLFIMDETPVLHTRPVASAYANQLKAIYAESAEILREYNVPKVYKTFSGFLADARELKEGDPAFLYHLFRGYQWVFDERPDRFTRMLKLQLTPFDPDKW